MSYAPSENWNPYFRKHFESGTDLDWGTQWTGSFIQPLQNAKLHTILDLGCGTGNDVRRFAEAGFVVTGLDYSREAIQQAQTKLGSKASVVNADMAQPLPFSTTSFDAVMSNVAVHMFSDRITRRVFAEIQRVVRPGGMFLFHVNSLDDRPFRARRVKSVRELEPHYILEETGQTVRFFSKDYLIELLENWQTVSLEEITIFDQQTNAPFKKVWRGIARSVL